MRAIPWILLVAGLAVAAVYLTDTGTTTEEEFQDFDTEEVIDERAPTLAGQGGAAKGSLQGADEVGPVLHELKGRVENADGTPAADITVTLYRTGPGWGGDAANRRVYAEWTATRLHRSARGYDAPSKPETVGQVQTAEDGTFHFDVRRHGSYRVTAEPEAPLAGETYSMSLYNQTQAPFIILRLFDGAALRGRVVTHDEQPVAAIVSVTQVDRNSRTPWRTDPAQTDGDGRFSFQAVPEGKLRPSVTVKGRMRFTADVIESPTTDEVVIVVPHGNAAIEGRVHDEEDNAIAGATLMLSVKRDDVPGTRSSVSYRVKSDAEGRYRLEGVVEGTLSAVQGFATGFAGQSQSPPLARWAGTKVAGETALDIQLIRGGTVMGIVRRKDGPPLEGATVSMMVPRESSQNSGTLTSVTGSDGRYVITGVPAGKLVVVADHPEYYLPATEIKSTTRTPPPELLIVMPRGGATIERDLEMAPGLEVRGQVVAEDGTGVADAEILAKNYGLGNKSWNWGVFNTGGQNTLARSEADGSFHVRNLAPRDNWELGARKRGFVGSYAEAFKLSADAKLPPLKLKMRIGATIEGRVVDGKGEPLPRVQVNAWGNSQNDIRATYSVRTSRDGTFVFEGLSPGNLNMNVWHNGMSKQQPLEDLKPGEVRRGIEIKLGGGERVTGVLVDEDDKPVAGMYINLTAVNGGQMGTATTDDEGRFEFNSAKKGPVKLTTWADGSQVNIGKSFTAPAEDIRVVYKKKDTFVIEVNVLDDKGAPVPLVVIDVKSKGGSRQPVYYPGNQQGTDVAGGHLRRVIDGKVPITIRAFDARDDNGQPMNLKPATLTLKEKPEGPVELRMEAGDVLKGRILGPDDEPVPDVVVKAGDVSVVTDEQGTFRLLGLADAKEVKFNVTAPPEYVNPGQQKGTPGEDEMVIRLVRGLTIAGKVELEDENLTFQNGWVMASWKAAGGAPRGSVSGQLKANRTFEVKQIPAGVRVTLRVQVWNQGGSNIAPATVNDVEPGDQNVRVVLGGGLSISGVVVNADGTPADGQIHVYLQDKDTKQHRGGTQADSEGKFTIKGVPPGTYIVNVWIQGGGSIRPTGVEVTAPASNVRVELPRASVLSGRIDPMPETKSQIQVRAVQLDNKDGYGTGAKVNEDGTWSMQQVPDNKKWVITAQIIKDNLFAQSDTVSSGDTGIVLRFKPGGKIEGRVVMEDGSDPQRAWIVARAEGWVSYSSIKDGAFTLTALPPGSYKLEVRTQNAKGTLDNVATGTTDALVELKENAN